MSLFCMLSPPFGFACIKLSSHKATIVFMTTAIQLCKVSKFVSVHLGHV